MPWPNRERPDRVDDPPDTRQNAKEKHKRGDQDSSPDGARKIAKRVEDKGGFWGSRKNG